jgi:hypothetical protein
MLKMRREWRRTSSSQADPSPWRHCWTSWASCSNVSSASNPGTVTCATTLGQFLVNRGQPISACHTMERKVPPESSPRHSTPWAGTNGRILLIRRKKHNEVRLKIAHIYPEPASTLSEEAGYVAAIFRWARPGSARDEPMLCQVALNSPQRASKSTPKANNSLLSPILPPSTLKIRLGVRASWVRDRHDTSPSP